MTMGELGKGLGQDGRDGDGITAQQSVGVLSAPDFSGGPDRNLLHIWHFGI